MGGKLEHCHDFASLPNPPTTNAERLVLDLSCRKRHAASTEADGDGEEAADGGAPKRQKTTAADDAYYVVSAASRSAAA